MTVPNTTTKIIYKGDGLNTLFEVPFPFLEAPHLALVRVDAKGGEYVLTQDYFVDKAKGALIYPGYPPGQAPPQIERPPVLPKGEKLLIYRVTPQTQDNAMPGEAITKTLEHMDDKNAMCIQEMQEKLDRCIVFPVSSDFNASLPSPVVPGASIAVTNDGASLRYGANPDGIKESVERSLDAVERVKHLEQVYQNAKIGDATTLNGKTDSQIINEAANNAKSYTDNSVTNAINLDLSPYAKLLSPVFTGTPKVPGKTSAATSDGALIATEAQVALKANIASPAFTGTPTAPTPAAGDNDTSIATTAFVTSAVKAAQSALAVTSAWLYPNGGTAAAPANVEMDSRYVLDSPWPGYKVKCEAEILLNGIWMPSSRYNSIGNGTLSAVLAWSVGNSIILVTGSDGLWTTPVYSGGPTTAANSAGAHDPTPCRIYCEKGGPLP